MEKQKKFLCPLRSSRQSFGTKPAIISNGIEISFERLDNLVDEVGERLTHFRKQKIAIYSKNPLHTILLIFACFRKGITPLLMNTKWPKFQLENCIKGLDCKLFLTDNPTIKFLDIPCSTIDKLLSEKKPIKSPAHIDNNAGVVFYTSSSTGFSKACLLSLTGLLTSSKVVAEKICINEKSYCLLTLPLFHVAGFSVVLRSILSGATVVVSKSLDLETYPISHISLVPTQLYRLLQEPKKVIKKASKNLKSILVGGGPIGKTLLEEGLNQGLPIHVSYGLTELSSTVFLQKNPCFIKGQLYLKMPLKHIQGAISEEGELLLKGPSLFQGYLEEGGLNTCVSEKGWFSTKDLVKFCPKKGFCIAGRKDNQFISGGENIQPEQIEKKLMSLEKVFQAIVVPIQDKEFGQRPVAFILSTESSEKIKKSLEKTLPKYKIPTHFFPLEEESSMKWKRADLMKSAVEKSLIQ